MTILLLFTMGIGQMWADNVAKISFKNADMASSYSATKIAALPATVGDINVSMNGIAGFDKQYVSSSSTKDSCIKIDQTAADAYTTKYLQFSSTNVITKVELYAAIPGSTSASNEAIVGWTDTPSDTPDTVVVVSIPGKGTSNLTTINFPSAKGIKYVRCYRQIKIKEGKFDSKGTTYGSTTTWCVAYAQVTTYSAAPATNYTVTINPNGGSYASTPDGWTYSAGVYTKSIAGGTSFSAPAGLTKGTDELSWKDGEDHDITFPTTISADITFVAQWTPVSAAPTISAHPSTTDVQYIKDATATALSVTAAGSGTVTYQWYSNTTKSNEGGTVLENCTTATYTPSTATTGKLYYYCEVTNTETSKSPKTIKSNVSGLVRVVPAPTHLVENVMATSGSWDSYIVSTNAHISNLKTIAASDGKTLIKSGKESASSSRTPGITSNSSATLVENDYIYLQFTIEDGYELAVSAVSVPVFSISNEGKYVARLSDNAGTPHVIQTAETSVAQSADGDLFTGYDFSSSPKLTGTVTMKLFAYGWSNGYRMKSPVYIDGTISEVDVTAPTFVSSVPANSATGVDVSGTIVLTFSENIASVDDSKFSLSNATIGTVAIDGTDATKVNVPYTDAVNEATVTLSVAADAVADAAGNKSAALSDITFTIAASGVCVKPAAPENLGVVVKTNNYAKFSWDGGSAGANGYQIALTSEAVGATGKFDWKNETTAIYEATNLTPATEYTFKVKYKGTVDDCFSDEVTETFTTYSACTELVPEISGEKPEVGDEILLQTGSAGGKIVVAGKKDDDSFSYSSYGLLFNSGGKDSVRVELNSLMKEGTVIALTIVSNGTTVRGLNLNKTGNATVYEATWTPDDSGEEKTFYYVVTGSDGLKNTNKFWLARNASVYLKSLTVSNCGSAVYDVTFDMKEHGAQVAKQVLEEGAKVTEPAEPEAAGYIFGGWYKETTLENAWNFSTDVVPDHNITLYAKWTEDPCTDRRSLSKVVLTAKDAGTVTGYNGDEYAGAAVIDGLKDAQTEDLGDGDVTGYKMNSGGSAIVFATLKKGSFQAGDKVVIGITKKQDSYKIADVSQNVLRVYYGTNASDAALLTTIENVTTYGYYTYRLTEADVTTIGEKKGIGLFRESSNGQNPYVYSVEITGCRSWTTTHTVTYNKMGKGADIAPAVVAVGDLVPKPAVVDPEGWALAGWYKEEGLVNEWNFASDVMPDNNLTLYAKWEDESGAIKLFDGEGNLNTTNFVSAAKDPDGINISEVNYPCLVSFGSNRSDLKGTTQADVVQYNATTNTAKIKLDLYNNASGAKDAYLWMVEEGDESATPVVISVPGKTRLTTSYTSFNSEKPRSFYLTSGSKADIKVLQVKVLDNGTAIPQFGKAGYAVNLNKGRIIAPADGTIPFDGATMHSNEAYTVLNSSNFKPKTYIQFTNAVANTIVHITKASSNAYYVTNDLEHKGDSYTTDKDVVLTTTGTWYIGSVSSGSVAAFTKIEFIAPKCETPVFSALANSDICEGDPYVALDGTGTVTDGGTITYKWYAEGGTDVLGTDATYMPTADGSYFVVALHHVDGYTDNEATSDVVTVATHTGTAITEGLAHVRKTAGEAATLTVEATGKNLHYAWKESETIDGTYTDVAGAADNKSLNILVPDGVKYYKVIVSSDCGADQESIAKVEKFVPVAQVVVTNSMAWDLTTCADAQIKLDGTTSPKKGEECLMANIEGVHMDENFHSESLVFAGEYIYRTSSASGHPTCATYMKFETSVAGLVRVHFAGNGDNRCLRITSSDNVQYSSVSTGTGDDITEQFEVAAGEIELMGMNSGHTSDKQYMRFYQIEFLALADRRAGTWVKPGELGTVCLENTSIVKGATIYELQGPDQYGKLVFDEVQSGEVVAGIPYLFEATAIGQISFYKKVNAAHADEAGELNGMHGTFSGETFSPSADNAANLYYFSGNAIWCVANRSTDANIPAHGCYLNMEEFRGLPIPSPTPAPGRRRITLGVNGKNTTTAIDNAEAADAPRKVMINGTLFILRGEKMYDATGRLVK